MKHAARIHPPFSALVDGPASPINPAALPFPILGAKALISGEDLGLRELFGPRVHKSLPGAQTLPNNLGILLNVG